ncbi:LptA/OstA family protein [bacterium endosymbiont of Pedicinus badii]|uniref:LptA/OstA family protein n=1 Tax=bacterium endosymbiont of Pedicinus badii TaxID=1719126 RepID=UPI0009BB0CE6|nr:LptA/OstA family protein [bacterium endosymbiont of Pedicinus badii]OQM34143.1 hypothetical protein AOQ89_02265 [bacterium endosymbiont of Pedicinus badii]
MKSVFVLFFVCFFSFGKTVTEPIYINSKKQIFNISNNTATFLEDVKLEKKFIKIFAKKVILKETGKKEKITLECFGNPVFFLYENKNEKIIIEAKIVKYDTSSETAIFYNEVLLKRKNIKIKSEKIFYIPKKNKIIASGEKKKVHLILSINKDEKST